MSHSDALTEEETAERYEQLGKEALPQDGEDVVAWIMRTRAMTFPEAVLFANELLEEDRDA